MKFTLRYKVIAAALFFGALLLGGCSHSTTHGGATMTTQLPLDDGLFHMRPCTTTN